MLTGTRSLIFFVAVSASARIADYPADTVAGIPVNYTETLAGTYKLPDLLTLLDGKHVKVRFPERLSGWSSVPDGSRNRR